MKRVFVISPLRGTPSQIAAVEAGVKRAVDGWVADGARDPVMLADFEASLRKKLMGDLAHANSRHAEFLCKVVAQMGHAAFAPHLFYTRFLDDTVEVERLAGIDSGLAWLAVADEAWVYRRHGVSAGMEQEITKAKVLGRPIIVPAGWHEP